MPGFLVIDSCFSQKLCLCLLCRQLRQQQRRHRGIDLLEELANSKPTYKGAHTPLEANSADSTIAFALAYLFNYSF